ncbi:traB domain-containing protein [Copidosoma floridanum]|uniref:traB domain-containing protein n=1 Tax=Copidosoma floridanum TaxID=29053 RepID=UPI0006C98901|nr:traB domain-containing protein [Copidosoma floridanum]
MASSEATSAQISMEENEKLLSTYKDSKHTINFNDKSAVNDFINAESGRFNVNPTQVLPTQHAVLIEPESINAPLTPESSDSKTGTSESNLMLIDNVNGHQNVGLEVNDESRGAPNKVLDKKVSTTNFDDNLPNTVTLLTTPEGSKCYLVGTAHFSIESQNDVAKVIQAVQPHIVMVELCKDRIHVLQLDEKTILEESKNLKMNKILNVIKQHGAYKGLFYLLLLNLSAHLTKVLGMAPGGEFRTAFNEAKKIPNCLVQMGDRPIKITFARAFNSLSWWQTIKLIWHLLREKQPISQEDIEKYKCRDSLEQIMAELVGEYPELGEVFVHERDLFLTHSLQLACRPRLVQPNQLVPVKVVGVVGIGHTLGIVENWGKVDRSQIVPIMSIPPTSMTTKVLKLTFKASIVGVIFYAGYKIAPVSVNVIQSIKSSVEGLIKSFLTYCGLRIDD